MLEITIPTLADPGLAPAGRHVMSVIVQYAPYTLAAGWATQRTPFADLVIDTLGAYAPQLRDSIRAMELLAPPDIEREFRITGGHWHHAELALDQFLMVRPVPGAAPVPLRRGLPPGRRRDGAPGAQRGAAAYPRGGLSHADRERTALPPAASEDAVPRARPRTDPARQLRALGRLLHRRRVHQRRAGVLRDPQLELALRPDADGQVPDRRCGCAAIPQPPGHA